MARQSPQPEAIRREQVLQAAGAVLLEVGPERLTMEAVATQAKLAKGTVYLYYPSKQALLDGLRTDLAEKMMAGPRALIADASLSWAQRLDGLVAAWLHFDAEHMPLFHAVFHEGSSAGPDAGLEPCLAALEQVLRGGKRAGEFQVPNIKLTARFLLHGYAAVCLHGEEHSRDHGSHGAHGAAHTHMHSTGGATPLAPAKLRRMVRDVQSLFRNTVAAADS